MFLFYSLGGEGRKNSFVTPPRRLPATQTRLNFAPPGHGCMYLELPKMMVSRCPPPLLPLWVTKVQIFSAGGACMPKNRLGSPIVSLPHRKKETPFLKSELTALASGAARIFPSTKGFLGGRNLTKTPFDQKYCSGVQIKKQQ